MPARQLTTPDPDIDPVEALTARLVEMSELGFARFTAGKDGRDRRILLDLRERGLATIKAEGWRTDPFTMARHLEGDEFADYRHTVYLAARFRDAVLGVDPFQIWNLPSQLGKSALVRRGISWALDNDPRLPIIYVSYADVLAHEAGRWVRDYGITHADRLRYRLRPDTSSVGRWLTTEGGGLLAAGIGAGIAGFPAGGIVIDDPHKSHQEASSLVAQEQVWSTYRSVLRVRVAEGGFIIIIHTRWCDGDLTDRVLKHAAETGERWTHVSLPMLAGDNDLLGRAVGEPLEPRRYSLTACHERAAALGSFMAAAVEQQAPAPVEGGLIKRVWWKIVAGGSMPETPEAFCSSWDMKLKDRAGHGDFVVGQVWGRTGGQFWCYDQFRGQWSQATVKAAIALAQVRWPWCTRHVIENTGNGPEVMDELRRGHPEWVMPDDMAGELAVTAEERAQVEMVMRAGMANLVAKNPKGNKFARAIAVTPMLEAGNVHLRDAMFAEDIINESAAFPTSGVADDQVDAWSQALAILAKIPGTTSVVSAVGQQLARPAAGIGIPGGARLPAGSRLRIR